MAALFISDLHLDVEVPETIERFARFLEGPARAAERLYILGDLFEAWIGDDDDDARLAPVLSGIARLTRSGVPCTVMHGNRDFLIADRFCADTGTTLFGDFAIVDAHGARVLLTHGDLLCTDDVRYQTLRAQLRSADWQREFLVRPLAERRKIASDLRKLSASEIAMKAENIMDVNEDTVARVMREHGVTELLHGHTHRPAIHLFSLDGRAARRTVLGAWHDSPSVIAWDAGGPRFV